MRYRLAALVVSCVLASTPWVSHAQEKTSPQEEKKATAEADEDTKFQESINSLGLSAGYAGKCNEKNAETIDLFMSQALAAANQLTQLFGTDAAFRFVFYAGLGGAGFKLDTAKCEQYTADWTNFVKKHPELLIRQKKEKN